MEARESPAGLTVWDDSGLCEPEIARARGYACCRSEHAERNECAHALLHQPPLFPRWDGRELLINIFGMGSADEEWYFAVHGVLKNRQPSPVTGWADAWVLRVDGEGLGLLIDEDDVPDDERNDVVREFVFGRLTRRPLDGWLRPQCAILRRPDPLFRLRERGRRLWFDARWPIPDSSHPIRVLTGGKSSAGWTDLAAAHEYLSHVNALASAHSLVTALEDSARPDRWGGVAITRGGGPAGHLGDWRSTFNAPEVIEAVREVQATGIPVLVGVGHDADRTALEAVADFSWPTPSMLGEALMTWRQYLFAELASPDGGLPFPVYAAGRAVRQRFDDAWIRARRSQPEAMSLVPDRAWPGR